MNNKLRGNSWERESARLLSLALSNGERDDIFWRTASSGALATMNEKYKTQRGDLCVVVPEYEKEVNFVIECKALNIKSIVPTQAVLYKILVGQLEKYGLDWLVALKTKFGKFVFSPIYTTILKNTQPVCELHIKRTLNEYCNYYTTIIVNKL